MLQPTWPELLRVKDASLEFLRGALIVEGWRHVSVWTHVRGTRGNQQLRVARGQKYLAVAPRLSVQNQTKCTYRTCRRNVTTCQEANTHGCRQMMWCNSSSTASKYPPNPMEQGITSAYITASQLRWCYFHLSISAALLGCVCPWLGLTNPEPSTHS